MKKLKNIAADPNYVSRTKLGYCNNTSCPNKRRGGSAYCQECADAHSAGQPVPPKKIKKIKYEN